MNKPHDKIITYDELYLCCHLKWLYKDITSTKKFVMQLLVMHWYQYQYWYQ